MANPVGLVGVGKMGQALLHRLQLADISVKAYDIAEGAMAAARDGGAETAANAAEAARDVELVHVFVRTGDEVIEATLGTGGVLEGAAKGSILLLHSTVLPETTRRVAEAAAKQDMKVVDAPVTAVPRRVHAGEAEFLVGGAEDVVAVVRPHLQSLGKAVHHFGPLGTGNVAKLAKNLSNAVERVMLSEILAIVEAGGLDPQQFLAMARGLDAGSLIGNWEKAFNVEDGHVVPRPASNLLNKDCHLAADLADALGLEAPLTHGTSATAAKWVKGWEEAEKASRDAAAE